MQRHSEFSIAYVLATETIAMMWELKRTEAKCVAW